MKSPAFQFYPDDFMAGTFAMTDAEVGQYIRLLCKQWNRGSIDPESAVENIRSSTVSQRVLDKFRKGSDGMLRNQRLEEERKKQANYRRLQSVKGKASAKARFNRGSTGGQPVPDARLEPNGNSPISDLHTVVKGTNGATTVVLGKELDRVLDRMKTIKATYGDHQSWGDDDVAEYNKLRIRRGELRQTLGVQV